MKPLFTLTGTVIKGKNRGKSMGFPTANFPVDIPIPQGIYISKVVLTGRLYPAITFVGTVDTFNEDDYVGESYILDFNQDIYGEEIMVSLIKKLRENQKFESENQLIEQMKEDERRTREYFAKLNE